MSMHVILNLGDQHRPFHDPYAWELALKIGQATRPKHCVNLGDIGDQHAFARHPKSFGRKHDAEAEMEACREHTAEQRQAMPHAVHHWQFGNHDTNIERYVAAQAPQAEFALRPVRELYGIPADHHVIPYKEDFDLGVVTFAHHIGNAGKSAVRQNLVDANRNLVTGHTHRAGVLWGGTTHEDGHFAMECGWLGDKTKITYLQKNQMKDWRQGVGIVEVDTKTGYVWPRFVPFVFGHAYYNGHRFSVRLGRSGRRSAEEAA